MNPSTISSPKEKAAPVWLVVGCGSALLVQRLSSCQTKDVDVMALREWEGNIVSAEVEDTCRTSFTVVAR